MSTGTILLLMSIAFAAGLLVLEVKTLKDDIPDNHITAVVRAAVMKQAGPFILLAWVIGFISGHLFWP